MKHINERLARLSRRLDPFWWLAARVLRLGKTPRNVAVPTSVLLVELNLLGDMVMLIPLLRVIRRAHPGAWVGLMSGPWGRDVLGDSGLVDEFITLRAPWVSKGQGISGVVALAKAVRASRTRRWDWGIDVRGDVRNGLLLALARAERRIAFDFSGGSALLTDVVPDDGVLRHIIDHHAALADYLGMPMTAEESVPTLCSQRSAGRFERGPRPRVGFHFGASMALRKMPLAEACALIGFVQAEGQASLILFDAPDVREFNTAVLDRLHVEHGRQIERWQGNLKEFINFLKTLDQFYAMDSGPAHVAAALGVDTTVFFGPHLSLAVCPRGSRVTLVERSDVSCRPCDQHRCTNSSYQQCLTGVVALLASGRHGGSSHAVQERPLTEKPK